MNEPAQPTYVAQSALGRIKALIRGPKGPQAQAHRVVRRRAITSQIFQRFQSIKYGLFAIGAVWMLAIPFLGLSNWTYIDENALQPSQVNTYWNWGDVHRADLYLTQLETLRDNLATSAQRAQFFREEFERMGLAASTQSYNITGTTRFVQGINAYAVFASPRASGAEAMVISASWLSRAGEGDGSLNLRGVATVLALAAFLKQYSLWAKDIIFIISDGYEDGMHAWLSAYHGTSQSNMFAAPLSLSSGVIWTALSIDYPGHSFSHLGVFFEGLNGRLPNQDLVNSIQDIATRTGGVEMVIYDHTHEVTTHPFLPDLLVGIPEVQKYLQSARNIYRHMSYEARGRGSGNHALFHQYRIDAVTIFAVPAVGPHGFYTLGRVIESTMRTTNNLLERLHASFFFYIFTGPRTFLKIGFFLPSAVLISVGVIFAGLYEWVKAGWVYQPVVEKSVGKWVRRQRLTLEAMSIMLVTHVLGAVLFVVVDTAAFHENQHVAGVVLSIFIGLSGLISLFAPKTNQNDVAPLWIVLKAFNLCISSTIISATSVLNFSLAAVLSVVLGIPITFARPSSNWVVRIGSYLIYVTLAVGWLVWMPKETLLAFQAWDEYHVWFALFICVLYVPLTLQAAIVCLLPL